MEWQDLLIDGYGRVVESMERILKGLTQDELSWQPRADCNSIGWISWHLTRQHDAQVSDLLGEEQLWIKDEWYARFNRSPNPGDSGFGHTTQQVAVFKSPDIVVLVDYQRAVFERSKRYFYSLSKTDLDRKLDEPFQPLPTVGVRLISILEDSLLHVGQISYIRGLHQGKGWQKY